MKTFTSVWLTLPTVILADGIEGVDDSTRGDGAAGMHRVRRNDRHHARPQALHHASNSEIKLTLDHVHDLFVRMGVFGQHRAWFDGPMSKRHELRMHKVDLVTREWLFRLQVLQSDEGHERR